MTAWIMPICVLVSWMRSHKSPRLHGHVTGHGNGLVGVFVALDFVLFFVFWEGMLVPMYLLIGVWGGPNRLYAAIKFFLYTAAGSLLLLVAILVLYFYGGHTFDILALNPGTYLLRCKCGSFWRSSLAFAVKVPMFPFHTLAPGRPRRGSDRRSVILASILLKWEPMDSCD